MGGGVERRPGGTSLIDEAQSGGRPGSDIAPGKCTLTEAIAGHGVPGKVRVTADHGLRVRKTPDSASPTNVLGILHKNAEIEALGKRGAWLDVFFRSQPAVIHSGFVEPVRSAGDAAKSSGPAAP